MSETLSALGKKWILSEPDSRTVQMYKLTHDLSVPVSHLLVLRNIALEDVPNFISPTLRHYLSEEIEMTDLWVCVERIQKALFEKEKVLIWGDYDVDGATSTSLLVRFFKMMGLEVEFYIPDRQTEGYGPNTEGFLKAADRGVSLVITVDCGTLSVDTIAAAAERGVDTIVIDHHQGVELRPACVALINPNQYNSDPKEHKYQHLAAVGICFLVCVALVRDLKKKDFAFPFGEPDLLSLLDLVALGTVCDVVSLTTINRAFVRQGLQVLSKTNNAGLKYFFDLLSIPSNEINTYHLGYVIGPRINAGGRIGTSSLGTSLLVSGEDHPLLSEWGQKLHSLNEERKLLQATALQEAYDQVNSEDHAIVVASPDWHQGVIGIVAGRLKDRHYKPTFVITMDPSTGIGKGSCRSIPGFHVGNFLHDLQDRGVIIQGGGHGMAGGFNIYIDRIQDFKASVEKEFVEKVPPELRRPSVHIDFELSLEGLTLEFFEDISVLGPFGASNPEPKFQISKLQIKKCMRVQNKHLRCIFRSPASQKILTSMIFNAFDSPLGFFMVNSFNKHVDIVGTLKSNTWEGNKTINFMIEDVRLCS